MGLVDGSCVILAKEFLHARGGSVGMCIWEGREFRICYQALPLSQSARMCSID